MKTILLCPSQSPKRYFFSLFIAAFIFLFSFSIKSYTQTCGAGYTTASINWDNLDYLHSNGYYGTNNPITGQQFVTATMRQTQKFAMGTNFMTLTTLIPNNAGGALSGDVTTHTGETGAYGFGADIAYVTANATAATITLTFDQEVTNLKFSVFDIDQEITFAPTATNAGGTAQSITLTKPAGVASAIPLNGNAAATTVTGTAPLANWTTGGGSGTAYAVTDNRGTINVDIAGPVRTVVLTFSNDNNTRDFYLSDLHACINNTTNPIFPIDWHRTYTEPWTGQPAYFISNPQSLHVYMISPTASPNPTAQLLFSETGTGGTKMNSLAYDPVGHYLYYVMDNAPLPAGPMGNVTLKRFNFNTEQIETVVDVRTLGIPCFEQGVEFAGAAFYNGSLYLGVEGTDGVIYQTNAESIVWRIDFDGSYNPVRAVQAFATPGDNGTGTVLHDWGDFIVKDSTIITHATTVTTNNNQYIHVMMQSNTSTVYAGNAETAGQLGMTYDRTVYRTKAATAQYNNNGTIGAATNIVVTSCSPAWVGNAGDASDPFKPKADFGDAPATYDPVALSPAVNDSSCNNTLLRIGSAWGREWAKLTSANATGDDEEDGISTVTVINANGVTYNHVQQVSVLNNTGGTITYAAWLDYNFNGVFDVSEGRTATIGSSASLQTVTFTWSSINIPSAGAPTSTFLRVRTASTAMTSSNATGWFEDGETEDYLVPVTNVPLAINLIDFNVLLNTNKTVDVKWSAISTEEGDEFEIQRSQDQINWTVIGTKEAGLTGAFTAYSLTDTKPYSGKSYYRLRLIEKNGNSRFSNIKSVYLPVTNSEMTIAPNPVNNNAVITVTGMSSAPATFQVRSLTGQTLISKTVTISEGENRIPVDVSGLNPGIYIAELKTKDKTISSKMSVTH
jgi:hypothetical protein